MILDHLWSLWDRFGVTFQPFLVPFDPLLTLFEPFLSQSAATQGHFGTILGPKKEEKKGHFGVILDHFWVT